MHHDDSGGHCARQACGTPAGEPRQRCEICGIFDWRKIETEDDMRAALRELRDRAPVSLLADFSRGMARGVYQGETDEDQALLFLAEMIISVIAERQGWLAGWRGQRKSDVPESYRLDRTFNRYFRQARAKGAEERAKPKDKAA